jgi:UDP-glucuronate 4-epimerase
MHILLTGGAGFIASHLAERLLRDRHALTIVDDFNDFYDPKLKRENIELLRRIGTFDLVEGDIRNSSFVDSLFVKSKFDQVVHLAARAGVRPSIQQPQLYVETNVTGTLNLLEGARRAKVPKFVFGSTSSVYGVNSKVPFSEDDAILHSISPYAATKLCAEQLCHNYHHLYGIEVVILRFFTVYGPRQRPEMAIHKFARSILKGEQIEMYGDGSTRRDYTYVADIADGVYAAMQRKLLYEIINLGDSNTVELKYLVALIEKAAGKKAKIKMIPEQPGDVPITFANIEKARRLLGYEPKVKIEEGIERFVQWYKQQKHEPRMNTDAHG